MLRLRAVAAGILVVAACGGDPPVELHTAADTTAVVPVDLPRQQRPPTTTTTTTLPPATTTTAPPVAAPPPPPAPTGDGCAGWRPLVASLWPASEVGRGCSVLMCESNGDPGAQNNSSSAAGLLQLLAIHAWRFEARGWSWADRYDPIKNATVAHDLWAESGWGPWVCQG